MSTRSNSRLLALLACAGIVLLTWAPVSQAQTKQFLSWMNDLDYLQGVPENELLPHSAGIEQMRAGIELWIKLHPDTEVKVQPAPEKPWKAADLKKQVSALHEALESILKEDPSRPFDLGVTVVSVTSEASPLSPVADSISRTDIQNLYAPTVGAALEYLPGLALDFGGRRNETGIRLRGYSNKGQIPLYLDGIPIQVPYDGTLDFDRFLTGDIAEIQVAKGYSSPLLGANNLGGSINLVTRQPEKKFESDALIGTGSGDTLLASLQLGTRWDQFYLQGSVDWLQRDFVPLSENFPLQKPATPSERYQTTYERNRSNSKDQKYSGRVAWTPGKTDRYVFSYINQKGEKGNPLYAGPNLNANLNYWDWPYWNKNSYYFITNTGLGESSDIKFRLFYDQFDNGLASYDNDTYSTMKTGKGFYSLYDDHTGGAATEFITRILPRNTIGVSVVFKDDTHKEQDQIPRLSLLQPLLLDRMQTVSIGFQDVITIMPKIRATFGFNADHLKGLHAQQRFNDTTLVALKCLADPDNSRFSGCTPHIWTYSPQISLSYYFTSRDSLFVTFSDRARFPLLKDIYSTKFNSSLPNPDLQPEHSRNWNIGLSHAFGSRTVAQLEYFHSDLRNSIRSVNILDTNNLCPSSKIVGYCGMNVNIAKESHQGFELSVRSTPVRRLTLDANYSYIDRTLLYEFANMPDVSQLNTAVDPLPTLPKNKVVFNAIGELPRKVLAIASFRYEGGISLYDSYVTNSQRFGSSHGVVDISTTVPVFSGVSLQAGVKNLFDRNYYYDAGYPEAGRNWYLNMRYRF